MAKVKIELDHGGMQSILDGDGVDIEGPLMEVAQRSASRARSTAPVDSGDYRDGIHAELDHTDRVVARVVATDWKSSIVEAKTGNLKRSLRR